MTAPPIPEELQVLAGEYVLGALDMAEMRAVRRRAMVDPALGDAIAGWERQLAPMATAILPVSPPVALWERIAEAVAPLADEAEPAARPRLVAPTEALGATPLVAPPLVPRLRPVVPARRVWPWQVATALSLAVAATVAAVALVPSLALRLNLPMPGSHPQQQVAALLPYDTHTPAFLAEARADGTVVLTALASVPVPAGKDLELWILPPGGKVPASLGVLPPSGRRLTLPAMPAAGTALMVSVEPPGGSPTGAPTGPVVFAGTLAPLSI